MQGIEQDICGRGIFLLLIFDEILFSSDALLSSHLLLVFNLILLGGGYLHPVAR